MKFLNFHQNPHENEIILAKSQFPVGMRFTERKKKELNVYGSRLGNEGSVKGSVHWHMIFKENKSLDYTLSHLSAHVVNRLLRENRKTMTQVLSGILFKNVTIQILNFIPVS